jgi:hypothetical protein
MFSLSRHLLLHGFQRLAPRSLEECSFSKRFQSSYLLNYYQRTGLAIRPRARLRAKSVIDAHAGGICLIGTGDTEVMEPPAAVSSPSRGFHHTTQSTVFGIRMSQVVTRRHTPGVAC